MNVEHFWDHQWGGISVQALLLHCSSTGRSHSVSRPFIYMWRPAPTCQTNCTTWWLISLTWHKACFFLIHFSYSSFRVCKEYNSIFYVPQRLDLEFIFKKDLWVVRALYEALLDLFVFYTVLHKSTIRLSKPWGVHVNRRLKQGCACMKRHAYIL